jgi:hypothetical protein
MTLNSPTHGGGRRRSCIDRRRDHPGAAGPRLVDDAYDASTRSTIQLRLVPRLATTRQASALSLVVTCA